MQSFRIATHNGTLETINLVDCQRYGRPAVPDWLKDDPDRMGDDWLVQHLLSDCDLQLFFDPKWCDGIWFVADVQAGDGVVINRDQLAKLMPLSPTTTTTLAPGATNPPNACSTSSDVKALAPFVANAADQLESCFCLGSATCEPCCDRLAQGHLAYDAVQEVIRRIPDAKPDRGGAPNFPGEGGRLWYRLLRTSRKPVIDGEVLEDVAYEFASWLRGQYGVHDTESTPAPIIKCTRRTMKDRLYVDEIDSFRNVRQVSPEKGKACLIKGFLERSEDQVQLALEQILEVPFHRKDWAGEINDLYTSNISINGTRCAAAFLLKGPGIGRKEMQIADCGKRGDQLVRLFSTPADLFVVQYVGPIADLLIKDVEGKVANLRAVGRDASYLIMDGQDTARLLLAYGKM